MPIPKAEIIKMAMEIIISYIGTVLMAIRVNIAIGEVNGTKEQIFIAILSMLPLDMENTTTIKAAMNKNVKGMTEVLMSSTLDAVEPMAPNKKA